MVDVASQVWVTVFGLSALLCMQTHRVRVRRMGVVLGLIGQPAWYIQLVIHEQWGMLPVFVGYTGVWLFGAWNLWISPRLGPLIDPLGEARHAVRGTSNDRPPPRTPRMRAAPDRSRTSRHPFMDGVHNWTCPRCMGGVSWDGRHDVGCLPVRRCVWCGFERVEQ